jgi:hypothetical protein
VDRVPVHNDFLGFGGTLLAAAHESTAYLAFTSRAPIVRWAGHSQGVDDLVDEMGAFFARLKIPVETQPGAEARICATDPEALYAVFIAHSVDRLHHSRRLLESDRATAGWIEHEAHRLAASAAERWEDGLALLDWLELG